MPNPSSAATIIAAVRKAPGNRVKVAVSDIDGVLRGKYIHKEKFYSAAEGGFGRSKLPVVAAFHNLLMDGIPKKFPKLRWGFIEVSAQWLPYAFNDLDLRFKRKSRDLPADPLKVNNMYVAVQCKDDLGYILKDGGTDNVVIGTDYGHADTSAQIEALRLLKTEGKVEKSVVDRILDTNARALYGL